MKRTAKKTDRRRPRHITDRVTLSKVEISHYMNEITVTVFGQYKKGESENRRITLKMQPADATALITELREANQRLITSLQSQLSSALGREA